ncbi:helix-turn-helix transcriptional regulator [Streptomyces sp. NPDC051976]|uniref:helix-turn-helix transcriptional regulator n=1 Tax=Streptomyces sp. NPDC051976 TaxID=3154947 RepID=UPI00342DA3EC
MLAALGLGRAEEEIYRLLVARARTHAHELAAETGRAPDDVLELLNALVARGLAVVDVPEESGPAHVGAPMPTVFRASPPAVALGGVLRRRRDDLRAAELELLALADQHRAATASGSVAEVITDADAVRHRFTQLQESARHEVRSMMVPDLTVVPPHANTAEESGVRRGVLYRTIVQRDALKEPGMVALALAALASGQQVSVTEVVPVKCMIADRELAMVPLLPGRNTAAASVLVHAGGLLEALVAYFELAWRQSYPLSLNMVSDAVTERRPDVIDPLDAQVLNLVLAGLTDQAAASQLGVSRRTVQRRIGELMVKAGAESRIQLGWIAARKGWA